MVTETAIQAYEQRFANKQNRKAARRPAVHAFRNLFGLIVLGGIIYVIAAFFALMDYCHGPNVTTAVYTSTMCSGDANGNGQAFAQWGAPAAFIAVAAYVAIVWFILSIKHSQGHKVRTIARYRRAQLYPGHPWIQYRIQHPYFSHVLVIGGMLTVLNLLGRKRI